MTTQEDFERRLAALEQLVSDLDERVRIEAGTRAAMDEELSGLTVKQRAQAGLLQALRETQAEHTTMLRGLRETQGLHTRALAQIEGLLAQVLRRLPEPREGA